MVELAHTNKRVTIESCNRERGSVGYPSLYFHHTAQSFWNETTFGFICTELGGLKPGNRPRLIAAELLNQMQNDNSKKKKKNLGGDPQ